MMAKTSRRCDANPSRIALGLLLLAALMLPRPAAAADTLSITLDQATIMKLPEKVSTIVVGNPLIADVAVQSGGLVVVTGKGYGSTNLIALDRTGRRPPTWAARALVVGLLVTHAVYLTTFLERWSTFRDALVAELREPAAPAVDVAGTALGVRAKADAGTRRWLWPWVLPFQSVLLQMMVRPWRTSSRGFELASKRAASSFRHRGEKLPLRTRQSRISALRHGRRRRR